MVFGSHLILDANNCDEEKIKDLENINNFIEGLCELGNMKRKGNLIVEEFEDNEFNREKDIVGYSVVQIISLSNITIHINFISKTVYLDFFTCGDLFDSKVIKLFQNYFKPEITKKIIIYRDATDVKTSIVF
jgi:S-adenosylmethionine/arginine decarboxylase-like enzyme